MDRQALRKAIREGKRPTATPPPSSEEEGREVPLAHRRRRSADGITIRDHPAVETPLPPQAPPPRIAPPPPARPAPPPVATANLARPEGEVSTTTAKEVEDLGVRYRVPTFIRLFVPRPKNRVTSDHPSRIALYKEFFKCGLCLSLHSFILNLLDRYELVPTQLTPNSVRIICCFVVLCYLLGSEARISLF